jgi:AGCS family alanine or glycine:cation symporter
MLLENFMELTEYALFFSCIFILAGSIYLTFKTRFIQFRFFPALLKMIKSSLSTQEEGSHTILPYKALFTAMSTTLGIGTIVGPVIAIHLGGPGALIGFILTSFFGGAATYIEVSLGLKSREKLKSGEIMGGPMQYLKNIFSPFIAKWYAICGFILMASWSGAQANQLASILDSPLMETFRIPTLVSGALIAVLVLFLLIGGIKRIGSVESKLIPVKFALFLSACFYILFSDLGKLWEIFGIILQSAFSPYAMASGTLVGGAVSALRWGVFKGTQACEAGVGTQTIPHSMAETQDPYTQGSLAMISTFAAGFVAFLSGCVALMTGTWQDPNLPLGISMVAASFSIYFSSYGVILVAACSVVFVFGTILGNSYNGSQCFGYLTRNTKLYFYYGLTALLIFVGAILEVKTIWSLTDIILAAIALPHMAALVLYAYKASYSALSGAEETPSSAEASLQQALAPTE